ncbi:MAG: hypothetical protein ACRCS8_01495 [Brevinema sp.]
MVKIAQRMAVKTCILRNSESSDCVIIDQNYLPITHIYMCMINQITQNKPFYLIFPSSFVSELVDVKYFYQKIALLCEEELGGKVETTLFKNPELERRYNTVFQSLNVKS